MPGDSGPPADDQAARTRTVADAETAIRDGLLYEHRRFTDDDLWMVLGELERLNTVRAENRALSGLLRGMAHRASRLRRQTNALIDSVAAVRALADDLPDLLQAYAWSHQDGTWLGYAEFIAGRIRAVLDGHTTAPAPMVENTSYCYLTEDHRHRWGLGRDKNECAECDADRFVRGPAEAAEPAWIATEGEALFRAQVAEAGAPEPDDYDGDELVLVRMPGRMSGRPTVGHSRLTLITLLEYLRAGDSPELVLNAYPSVTREQMRVVAALAMDLAEHDEMEGRAGSVTTTPTDPAEVPFHERPEDPEMPFRYEIEVWYPQLDGSHTWETGRATPADLAARLRHEADMVESVGSWTYKPPVETALIGTYADPEFVRHQDHRHPVDGCGYCPTDFEETT